MSVRDMMTQDQRAKVGQPKAWENTNRVMGFPLGATPFQMTGHFHTICGIPTPEGPIVPTVGQREQRLRFILEEFLELVEAMGFEIAVNNDGEVTGEFIENGAEYVTLDCGGKPAITVRHIEGSRYDVVETADALGDLNVVVNGTGVEFGIPMHFIDYEVYCSNLSKVPPGGEPIRNGITPGYRAKDTMTFTSDGEFPLDKDESGYRQDAPIGKILKPESFVDCNIPAVLVAFENKEI